jgi:hypothetical protein
VVRTILRIVRRFVFVLFVAAVLPSSVSPLVPPNPLTHAPAGPGATGYYTEAQAERGRISFERHCRSCHSAGQDGNPEAGFRIGSRLLPSNLGGRYILQKQNAGRRIYATV